LTACAYQTIRTPTIRGGHLSTPAVIKVSAGGQNGANGGPTYRLELSKFILGTSIALMMPVPLGPRLVV